MTGLALGIDLGTSGVRTSVLEADGTLLAMARETYGTDAQARRNPELWWTAVQRCLEAQLSALKALGHAPAQINALAVDGTSGSLVLTDAALVPVTRALMYDDAGFHPEAALIAALAPDPHITRGPGSALARALRLVAEDTGQRAVHLLHQADFIAARLMNCGGLSDLNNALKTGVDPVTGLWPDWMARLPLPAALLPRALNPGAPMGRIAPEVAAHLGLPPHTMVHAGTTDSIAAFLAAADPVPGQAVTSLGSTLAVKLMSDRRIDAPELGLYSHRIGAGWLVGGASNTGGAVLRSLFTDEELVAVSNRIDPNLDSPLDYYPLLRPGERFPIHDPTLPPRLEPRPQSDAAFLHGILEGIARIEARAYEVMVNLGAPRPDRILTAGGGASNQTWTVIRQRVLNIPVIAANQSEASIGAARLAMISATSKA